MFICFYVINEETDKILPTQRISPGLKEESRSVLEGGGPGEGLDGSRRGQIKVMSSIRYVGSIRFYVIIIFNIRNQSTQSYHVQKMADPKAKWGRQVQVRLFFFLFFF